MATDNHYDAIVLGLGAMGSAALFHLAERGVRVCGIDQHAVPHDLGSSHGTVRVIRKAYFEHPDYIPLLNRAYELWEELEERAQRRLFVKNGVIVTGSPDSETIQGLERCYGEHDLPHEKLDCGAARERFTPFQVNKSLGRIGEFISEERKKQMMPANQFAEIVGINASQLEFIENGGKDEIVKKIPPNEMKYQEEGPEKDQYDAANPALGNACCSRGRGLPDRRSRTRGSRGRALLRNARERNRKAGSPESVRAGPVQQGKRQRLRHCPRFRTRHLDLD